MYTKLRWLACWALLLPGCLWGQKDTIYLSLDEALRIAQTSSLDAISARNTLRVAYWTYRNYWAELLPNMVLDGTIPSLNKSLSSYQNEDGSYSFVSSRLLSENLNLSINQNIPYTGGTISLQSQLQRMDELDGSHATSYLSVPFGVTISQPLITARSLRWSMRIEPKRYKEAIQQYCVNMEAVNAQTVTRYFDFLLASVNTGIARQNLDNATELLKIARGKKAIGIISDNDLLQLELNRLNAASELIKAEQNYENKMYTLRTYLRYDNSVELRVGIPPKCPMVDLDYPKVLAIAYKNNPLNYATERQLLEARQQIAQAKADRGFQANVYASIGFTNSDVELPAVYRNLQNRQIVSLGIRIPILDWGKGKGRVQLAKSQQEVVKAQIERNRMDFEQNVMLSVRQWEDQTRLLDIAVEADSVAQCRYKTAYNIFVMGNINVLDINSAQVERDNARRAYIDQLYASWVYYYNIRQLTLYDFENDVDIVYEMLNK